MQRRKLPVEELESASASLKLSYKIHEEVRGLVSANPLCLFTPATQLLNARARSGYEDILLAQTDFAVQNDVERLLWKQTFHYFIEEYRRIIRVSSMMQETASTEFGEQLFEFLLCGTGFYRSLIVKFYETSHAPLDSVIDFPPALQTSSSSLSEESTEQIKAIVHRLLICIGDLWRYGCVILGSSHILCCHQWFRDSQRSYLQAHSLMPNDGSSHNQLAVLSMTISKDEIEAIYRYSLSIANLKPFPNAENNINQFFIQAKERSSSTSATSLSLESRISSSFVLLQAVIHAKAPFESFESQVNSFLELMSTIMKQHNDNDDNNNNTSIMLFKIVVVAIFSVWFHVKKGEQNSRFENMAVFTTLKIIGFIVDNCCSFLQQQQSEDVVVSPLYLVEIVNICVLWLQSHSAQLLIEARKQTDLVNKLYFHISKLCNELLRRYPDINSSLQSFSTVSIIALPEHLELRGFLPLSDSLKDYEFKIQTKQSISSMNKIRVISVLQFGKILVNQGYLTYSSSQREFVSKYRDLQPTSLKDSSKTMHKMAQKLLAHDVSLLKEDTSNTAQSIQSSSAAYIVCDSPSIINKIDLIKAVIDSGRMIVIIPLSVIATLDILKSGSDNIHRAARATTSYLEQTLQCGNPYLRVQQRSQVEENIVINDIDISDDYRRILSCCAFFSRISGGSRMVKLLTDDCVLSNLAAERGIAVETSMSLKLSLTSRSK